MSRSTTAALLVIGFSAAGLCVMVPRTLEKLTPKQMEMPQGGQSASVSWKGAQKLMEDTSEMDKTYTSSEAGENALLVSGKVSAVLTDCTFEKTGGEQNGDDASFYGTNAAVLGKDGASVVITGGNVSTSANGANGIFSYGEGTEVQAKGTTISTTADGSGGIMAAGGGTLHAEDVTVTTQGRSSAAIRSDRGGGTMTVQGGSFFTSGPGSPAIYSTADITVKDARLDSTASEGVVVEGANSVSLDSCTLTDANTQLNGQSTTYKNIFLYQSMSGDAEYGTASFSAVETSIHTVHGDTMYVTNTEADIFLSGCTLTNDDGDGALLRVQKDSWGQEGNNGGKVQFAMKNQKAQGDILADELSEVSVDLQDGSVLTGALNSENKAKVMTLKLSADSQWILTGDCYLTSFENADAANANIEFNGYQIYVNGKAIQ